MAAKVHSVLIVVFFVAFGFTTCRAESNETSQVSSPATSPAPVPRILTKDPEYLKLLTPPSDNEFLKTYSKAYREKSAEIEARIAGLGDENLRNEARKNEWAAVPKSDLDRFKYEADVAFRDAKISFLQKHQDGLFEVGRMTYDESNHSLVVTASPSAALDANFRVVINPATLNEVYDKFHEIASQEIDQEAHDYVSKAEPSSTCGRNPDLCLTFERTEVEQHLRLDRLVVVAGGDLASNRIDRLLLVDYDTEAVLLDLSSNISSLNNAPWRFGVGDVPTMPVEATSPEPPVQPGQNAENTPGENSAEAGLSATTSSNPSPNPVRIPDEVTAASVLSHPQPEYPPAARDGHIQGNVILRATIDKDGKISDVQVLSGNDLLAKSAVEAVRQWRYKPILIDGQPAEVETTITITFSLLE